MIIDIHGHTNAPPQLYAYKSGFAPVVATTAKVTTVLPRKIWHRWFENHLKNHLDKVGTDIQFLSPRPFQLMHSEKPDKIVHWWNEANNDVIKMTVDIAPTDIEVFAVLPQAGGVSAKNSVEELERCVKELGFVGCMINPDPGKVSSSLLEWGDLDYWGDLYAKWWSWMFRPDPLGGLQESVGHLHQLLHYSRVAVHTVDAPRRGLQDLPESQDHRCPRWWRYSVSHWTMASVVWSTCRA